MRDAENPGLVPENPPYRGLSERPLLGQVFASEVVCLLCRRPAEARRSQDGALSVRIKNCDSGRSICGAIQLPANVGGRCLGPDGQQEDLPQPSQIRPPSQRGLARIGHRKREAVEPIQDVGIPQTAISNVVPDRRHEIVYPLNGASLEIAQLRA